MNRSNLTRKRLMGLCTAATIAALYVALTFVSMAMGLDKNAIQVRFSEALVTLAYFTPTAIPGLYVGCLLANILTGCAPLDIALGPVATLIGAVGAYLFGRMKNERISRFICTVPNIIANTVIVSVVCLVCYTAPETRTSSLFWFYMATVALGEIVSSGILGTVFILLGGKTVRKIVSNY